jgi:hypothetical protein
MLYTDGGGDGFVDLNFLQHQNHADIIQEIYVSKLLLGSTQPH